MSTLHPIPPFPLVEAAPILQLQHKDCKNTKVNTLHFTYMFTSMSDITEHRIRDLLVFQDGTSRNKSQVFIYIVANYSSTENMH